MNVFFEKGDLVTIPADAPYYAVDCDSRGEFFVRSKASKQPILAIYLSYNEKSNNATVWMNNQEYTIGIKYVQFHRAALTC